MVKSNEKFNICLTSLSYCTPLNEVAFVKMILGKFIIEVIFLRQEQEGKFLYDSQYNTFRKCIVQ